MNIYEISQALLDIYNELEENGGELTEELEKALTITQADFKQKVRDYVSVLKQIDLDITGIDQEVKRLKAYKESKAKAKDRLSSILANAIDMFGEHTKSGGAYVDLGDEKVSVRNTTKVEVDTDIVNAIAKDVINTYSNLNWTNSWDEANLSIQSFIDRGKTHTKTNENGEEVPDPINIIPENYKDINATIKLTMPLSKLIGYEGVEFAKQLLNTGSTYSVEGSVSKTDMKKEFVSTNTTENNIAKLVNNKTISIK